MADINPLAFIGKSNDPTLGQRIVNADKVANQLQAGLARLNSQRAGQVQLADINNQADGDRNAVQQGFPDLSTLQGAAPELANRRAVGDFLKGAQGINAAAGGGVRILGDTPFNPQDILKQKLTPGQLLKGEAQSAAVPTVSAKQEAGTTTEGTRFNEATGQLEKVTTTEKDTQEGKTKGGKPTVQRAKQIQDIVAAKFRQTGRPFTSIEVVAEDDTHIAFRVDGGEVEVRPKTKKK